MSALPHAGSADLSVYLVTDAGLIAAAGHSLGGLLVQTAENGVTAVQIREKDAPAGEFLAQVMAAAEALPEHVSLIVNDRVDVFLAARALGARVAGVHVGQSDLPAKAVRKIIGPDALLGLSAQTPEQLEAAAVGGADYVGVGALHATATKKDAPAPLGYERFAELVAASALPAVAIGGVTAPDAAPVRRAGGAGIAVVSAICSAPDPAEAAARLRRAWDSAVSEHAREDS